jgi:hypothetical protein
VPTALKVVTYVRAVLKTFTNHRSHPNRVDSHVPHGTFVTHSTPTKRRLYRHDAHRQHGVFFKDLHDDGRQTNGKFGMSARIVMFVTAYRK